VIDWIMNTNSDKLIMDVVTKIGADHTLVAAIFAGAVWGALYLILPKEYYRKAREAWKKWRGKLPPTAP